LTLTLLAYYEPEGREFESLRAYHFSSGSRPETWVTERTGYMGNNLGPSGFVKPFQHTSLEIEVSQIIIYKADGPDVVVNSLMPSAWPAKTVLKLIFLCPS